MSHPFKQAVVATLIAAIVTGCAKQPDSPVPVPRPVKVEVVSDAATIASESFVGTLRARDRSDLGFEAPGRIAAILVEVGDHVHAGQVLARLDEAPVQWRLDKALADRDAAVAALSERSSLLRQNEALAKDQIISSTALEAVRTQHAQALGQLQAAEAALSLARRDMSVSRITAPYDGEIVARLGQPHSDIGGGQPLLQIEASGTMEVVTLLPAVVASHLARGAAAVANAAPAASPSRSLHLALEHLSARSDGGSLVQAIFRVDAADPGLRSGEVVSVDLPHAASRGFSVPAEALMPATQRGSGSVFLLDVPQGRIVRRAVRFGDALLPGGRVPVTAGLVAGEVVVVAGTAFLNEGQAAVRHDSQTLLHGGGR